MRPKSKFTWATEPYKHHVRAQLVQRLMTACHSFTVFDIKVSRFPSLYRENLKLLPGHRMLIVKSGKSIAKLTIIESGFRNTWYGVAPREVVFHKCKSTQVDSERYYGGKGCLQSFNIELKGVSVWKATETATTKWLILIFPEERVKSLRRSAWEANVWLKHQNLRYIRNDTRYSFRNSTLTLCWKFLETAVYISIAKPQAQMGKKIIKEIKHKSWFYCGYYG